MAVTADESSILMNAEYAHALAVNARRAATQLASLESARKNAWLSRIASELLARKKELSEANEQDLQAGTEAGLSSAMLDRLRLTSDRIDNLSSSVRSIISLPDPAGEVIEGRRLPNGMTVSQVRVPLGVVFFIYESRPNVTIDAAALCVKSGNAVILRGGKEAIHSNLALQSIIQDCLRVEGLPVEAVQLVESTDRRVVGDLLALRGLIDVTIPRGGRSLIERVTAEATMPVIKHFDGICHVYLDASADTKMATDIVVNSKCQRPGVCNAAETLLVHRDASDDLLRTVVTALQGHGVELRCCPRSLPLVSGGRAATEQDYGTEYLDLKMSLRIVDSIDEAIDHIRRYGSAHTDAIVTNCLSSARRFQTEVDSAAVMVNVSTRFNDGGELGLGAEIGISTDRFHARGPCGLRELTTYKYLVSGNGQIR